MKHEELHEIRKMTRHGYQESQAEEAKVSARKKETEDVEKERVVETAGELGYGQNDMDLLPEGITVTEKCGNPLAAIDVKPGQSVIVIGCGTGADCFLAASAVGSKGHVVGVEEIPDEVSIAREAARSFNPAIVEIRPGENENLPAADKSFDIALTNCAITFSYDKPRALREIARSLKPGGRLLMCEPVMVKEAAAAVRKKAAKNLECLENAIYKDDYRVVLKRAGLKKIKIIDETDFPVTRMLRDRRVRAGIKEGDVLVEDIENLSGAVTVVKIIAIR